MTFPSMGSDDALRAQYRAEQISERIERANGLMVGARALMAKATSSQGCQRAERGARDALAAYASALNWAEDTEDEERVHALLDQAGRWVRVTFGCRLAFSGKGYSQNCPVALGHNRLGFSVGGVARRTCSLCGQDLSECQHQRGQAYSVPGGSADLGWCRVCMSKLDCEHLASESYSAGVVAIITEMELAEVSLVGKPAQPDARIQSMSVDLADLQERLGPEFEFGMKVSCDRCLTSCGGLTKHERPHG